MCLKAGLWLVQSPASYLWRLRILVRSGLY